MIKQVMHRLMFEENAKRKKDGEAPLRELPKPCDYFDLIGGTGTGGCAALYIYNDLLLLTRYTEFVYHSIIALMLGRLRMDVDTAIEHYDDLAKQVFSGMKAGERDGKFRATKLEKAIKSVVETATGDSESHLLEGIQAGACRT
jgi:hypothetical protein